MRPFIHINSIDSYFQTGIAKKGAFWGMGDMNLPAKTAKQDTPCAKARSAMKNKGMSSEERQKMIADWLATWLKEGDSRLAMH